ncbi:MAG: FtsX-like permease family protein [Dehalococcoidia bacterium]|jgi:putative ABC transport system permease protein
MKSLFGIPMDSILVVMVVLLAIALATVGITALRNRVMFVVGVRNIPRRVAQTVLIIIGLMLSTLIISAAFTTGDTVDHSFTTMIYDSLGHVDEIVKYETANNQSGVGQSGVTIPESAFVQLRDGLAGDPAIDGIAPALVENIPAVNEKARLSAPDFHVVGMDPATMAAFPDIINLHGDVLDPNKLGDNEVYLNKSAADDLSLGPGDTVTIYFQNQPFRFTVADVVQNKAVTGAVGTGGNGEGMVGRLSVFQKIFNRNGVFDFIAISNTGGVRDSVPLSNGVIAKINQVIDNNGLNLTVDESKQDDLHTAELAGNGMMTFFLVLGLFSIAAGVLLIIMIFVMLAAERKMEMGIVRAVGTKRRHLIQMFMSEGMGYNMLSAFVGVVLGVLISFILTLLLAAIFSQFGISITPSVSPRSLVISYSLGIVLTFITVVFASWRVSNLNIVRAIRDLPEPEAKPRRRSLIAGIAIFIFSALVLFLGIAARSMFLYTFGFSFAFFGLALALRYLRAPERPLFTAIGIILLLFWLFGAGGRLPHWMSANRDLGSAGPEMFFLSGAVMVAAATFVLIYNADIALNFLSRIGDRAGRILPAIKTAIAYPLASKFRTGMTMAMISLVIFALTTMSAMNFNFERMFLSDAARGGWDVEVDENPNNPIGDLRQALAGSNVDTSAFTSLGTLGVAKPIDTELRQAGQQDFKSYLVKGADDGFLQDPRLQFMARATGYADDKSVWEALRTNPNLAVIDANALSQGFSFGGESKVFKLDGVDSSTTVFDPITVEMRDSANGSTGSVQIIGILSSTASGSGPDSGFAGLIVSRQSLQDVFGGPNYSVDVIRLANPDQSKTVAKGIESALFTTGAQANSIKAQRDSETATFRNFLYLMQAFMGLGLVVGVAAVGVIAFRTVVERRQHIGMLRAIGFKRGTVALSFLMESSFVTLLGIMSGVGLGLLLSYFLVTGGDLGSKTDQFYIPWLQVIFISAFAYGASLLMTFIPARQAASIPIAAALRYE